MPAKDSSPITPMFNGNWVIMKNQKEKIVHMTDSHISKILFDIFIVHLLSTLIVFNRKGL